MKDYLGCFRLETKRHELNSKTWLAPSFPHERNRLVKAEIWRPVCGLHIENQDSEKTLVEVASSHSHTCRVIYDLPPQPLDTTIRACFPTFFPFLWYKRSSSSSSSACCNFVRQNAASYNASWQCCTPLSTRGTALYAYNSYFVL